MSWQMKRFWEAAQAVETPGGFAVHLDGRPVKTPAKASLEVPTQALAQAIAAEWDAQETQVDPTAMPLTRAANAAIDKVTHQFTEVADMLAGYGDSDLTCYRADGPEALVDRQRAIWDPLLDWAQEAYNARLIPVEGVIHVAQSDDALQRLSAPLYDMSVFELTGMHDLVALSGSLVIGLAAFDDAQPIGDLWAASRLDETWQIEQWGEDEDAMEEAARKAQAFTDAHRFVTYLRE